MNNIWNAFCEEFPEHEENLKNNKICHKYCEICKHIEKIKITNCDEKIDYHKIIIIICRMLSAHSFEIKDLEFKDYYTIKVDHAKYFNNIFIKKIIKFKFNNLPIDVILCGNSPHEMISSFDFDFNKIYFDGYGICALKWKSVFSKTTYNKVNNTDNYIGDACRYIENIDRISKYTDRGFTILLGEKNEYTRVLDKE